MMTLLLQQEQGSYVGEVVKAMDKKKVLVKVHPEGKFVVDIDKNIDINDITPNCRVALRNDSYTLHKILPNKVDPLVSCSTQAFFVRFPKIKAEKVQRERKPSGFRVGIFINSQYESLL